jgi:CSLREA domain-containing protein
VVTPSGSTTYTANFIVQPPITVNTLGDTSASGDHSCSLREAINNANSPGTDTTGGDCTVGSGNDRITFSVTGIITLGSTLPAVANKLTIDGTGQTITVDGGNLSGILTVATGGHAQY